MVGVLVDSISLLDTFANLERDYLNAQSLTLHAYRSPVDPTPETALATLSAAECNFDTYSPISLGATWGVPGTIASGEVGFTSGSFSWPAPVAMGGQISGLYVRDAPGRLYLIYELPAPIQYNPGNTPPTFTFAHNTWARSVLP